MAGPRLVRLTPAGLAAFYHGRGVLAFYEAELAARRGPRREGAGYPTPPRNTRPRRS